MPGAKPKGILYACVGRGDVVLAEHAEVAGNVNVIATRILGQLPQEEGRTSYTMDDHMWHVLVTGEGITFLACASEDFGRRLPFAFLEDVKARFMSAYGDAARQAVAYEFNTDFSRVLQARMSFFTSDPAADAIGRVKGEMLQVKEIMVQNIEKVLERGEKLDLLVDKTDALQGDAFTFRREAKRARRSMWWQNARMWVIVGAIIAAVIVLSLMMACGITFSHC